MAGFRDDREALLARLAALETELARGGGTEERAALGKRLDELSAAVRTATERLDLDRGALGDLGARLDALRGDLGGAAPARVVPPPAAAPGPPAVPDFPAWKVVVPIVGLALIGTCLAVGRSNDEELAGSAPQPAVTPDASLPGGLHAFDPIAGLALARERSPLGTEGALSAIRAQYVSSNGRVDLDAPAYRGQVDYEFWVPPAASAAEPAAPVGVPRTLAMGRHASVRVPSGGMDPGFVTPYINGQSLPAPRCSLEGLWAVAMSRGAPRDAVATISYGGSADQGGRWTSDIGDTAVRSILRHAECLDASRPSEPAAPSP